MFPEAVIVGLLESACPSIQYRVRWEILAEPPGSETMEALHEQILQDQAVQELMRSQQADGWLGERFHGYDSLEAGIRLLCEKGVCAEQPVLARALGALESNSERIQRELGTVGVVLDAGGFGGTSMMRAAIFAYAGQEQQPLVQEQIQVALEGFQAVMAVESLDDLVEPYKSKLVFKPGVKWPGIYDLRLLAFTQGWRSVQNREIVTSAVKRWVALSPLPVVHVRHKSQLIAPASFGMHDFDPDLDAMGAAQWIRLLKK